MLQPIPSLAGSARSKPTGLQLRSEALDVAKQFEEFFARQLVKSFRETSVMGEEGGLMGNGIGSDTYTEWFDENMASHVTNTSRLGIADVLMRDFERYKQIPTAEEARKEALNAVT